MSTLHHRRADAVVTVLDASGVPLADTDVVVAQERHAFLFGNIGFDFIALANQEGEAAEPPLFGGASAGSAAALADLWLDVFNSATLPFYWGGFERVQGCPDTARLLTAARWFADRGVAV